MLNNIGLPGILLIAVVVLVLFGRGKISGLMGEVGKGITSFKKGISEGTKELDAEEITQEVMLSLWRKANTYDTEKASAATWVFTIARNHRIDLFRKSSRLKIDPLDPTFVPEPDLNPVQLLIKSQKKDRIRKIIGNLRNDQKELLMAAFFEGLAHAELAKRFDKPLGTIKSRLRLIYESLRKEENLLTLKGSDGYEN